jgi:hypothetical protein
MQWSLLACGSTQLMLSSLPGSRVVPLSNLPLWEIYVTKLYSMGQYGSITHKRWDLCGKNCGKRLHFCILCCYIPVHSKSFRTEEHKEKLVIIWNIKLHSCAIGDPSVFDGWTASVAPPPPLSSKRNATQPIVLLLHTSPSKVLFWIPRN